MKVNLFFALSLSVVLLNGCADIHQSIATSGIQINSIHMFGPRRGWAEANGSSGFRVLRTTDGGRVWKNVTPRPFPYEAWNCEFADLQTAWISIHNSRSSETGLLMTTNGGNSWARVTAPFAYFTEPSDVHFFHNGSGVGRISDGGLGSSYDTFYETHDAGLTWEPVNAIPRNPEPNEPHTFHLSNICGDKVACYPPDNFILAYGESGDEKPAGGVRLSISLNCGETWRDQELRLPDEFRSASATPFEPVFFNRHDALLPVDVFKQDEDSRTSLALLFYRTSDGGKSWTARQPLRLSRNGLGSADCDIISLKEIVVRDGSQLNITHDGGATWQIVKPNIDLGTEGAERDVAQIEFNNASRGWLILSDNTTFSPDGNFILYKTADGGKTWRTPRLKMRE